MSDDPLMSVTEAARFLNVSLSTIRRLIDQGELPAFKIGHQLRLFKGDVHLWLKSRQVVARRQEGQGDLALTPPLVTYQ